MNKKKEEERKEKERRKGRRKKEKREEERRKERRGKKETKIVRLTQQEESKKTQKEEEGTRPRETKTETERGARDHMFTQSPSSSAPRLVKRCPCWLTPGFQGGSGVRGFLGKPGLHEVDGGGFHVPPVPRALREFLHASGAPLSGAPP